MKQPLGILDNKSLGQVVSELKKNIAAGGTLAVVSALFSLYAYDKFKQELSKVAKFRLLVPNQGDIGEFLNNFFGNHLGRRLRNQLDLTRIARECSKWLQQKCKVRELPSAVHQNLIHLSDPGGDKHLAVVGSSSFTTAGLGIAPSAAHHISTCFRNSEQAHALLKWFDELWAAGKNSSDFGALLQKELALAYTDKTPRQIYFLTLFNLFRDLIGELNENRKIPAKLISAAQSVQAPQDEKLRKSKELIRHKVRNPINPDNKKVLVFTAFADTAKYVYTNTATWA